MKKLLCAFVVLAGIFVVAVLSLWWNLPSVSSYVIGRLAGGEVRIEQMGFGYKEGIVTVALEGVHLKGRITGDANTWNLAFDIRKGLYLKYITLSGFDFTITTPAKKAKKEYRMVPTDLLEARDGIIRYGDQVFTLKELVVEHLRVGKPFLFRIDVTNTQWFGNLKAEGEGLMKGKPVYFKGRASVAGMDMGQWTPKMAGITDARGDFIYEKNKLSVDGSFEVVKYALRISELKEHRFPGVLAGKVRLTHAKNITDIAVKGVRFKGTPFDVDIRLNRDDVSRVEISSGQVDMDVVKEYVNFEDIEKGSSRVWDYVEDGRVRIKKLSYALKGKTFVDFYVTGTRAVYKDVTFNGIEAFIHLDERNLDISAMSGRFKGSAFHDVSARFTLSNGKIAAKGAYSLDLKDIGAIAKVSDLTFKDGLTTGVVAMERRKDGKFDFSGSGALENGEIVWKEIPLHSKGTYRFTNSTLTFESLNVSRDGTDLDITGLLTAKEMKLNLKGRLDAAHVERIYPLPFKAAGAADLDVLIDRTGEGFHAAGSLGMNDVAYEFPDLMKKGKGIANMVRFDISQGDEGVHIARLKYDLDVIDLDVTGDIRKNRKMDLDVSMKVDGFERVAKLFLVNDDGARGDAQAVLSIRGVDLVNRRTSSIKGYMHVNNGFVRLPGMTKPFKEINLTADFNGNNFDIHMTRFRCGNTVLKGGDLHVEGLESPRFVLSLNMDMLDLADFEGRSEFKMSGLRQNNSFARANGRISFLAREMRAGKFTAKDLTLAGVMADRKINISEFKADLFGGSADVHGTMDFSGPAPRFYASGRIDRIKAGLLLAAFDANAHIFDSTGLAYGSLSARGEKPEEWLKSLNGDLTLYSKDGVIKKWDLLSKIFGVLNIYDLVRGKVDLRADGLPYNKMGASFRVKDGVFRTDNFIIDSYAMVITGAGDVNASKKEIAASITVSPLVAIDTFLDKIPIIRSVLRGKKKGFLYVSYDVKGPMDDPDVSVSFIDSIGTKPLQIIRNILTLPKEVFE